MNKLIFISCCLIFSLKASAQDSLFQARLKTLQGKIVPFSSVSKNDSLFLICFWSVNSEESITELNSINGNLNAWQHIRPFRFMAISVDAGAAANRLRPTYNMNEWKFDAYVDLYGDMRRSLHSNNFPQSIILYKGVIVYQQTGWTTGTENYLFEKLAALKH